MAALVIAIEYQAPFNPPVVSPPDLNLEIISPENTTYGTSEIQLNYTTDEHVIRVTYTIDSKESISSKGNQTITNLSNGIHNITLCAYGSDGQIASQSTRFSITLKTTVEEVTAYLKSKGFIIIESFSDNLSDATFGYGGSFDCHSEQILAYIAGKLNAHVIHIYQSDRELVTFFFAENSSGEKYYIRV